MTSKLRLTISRAGQVESFDELAGFIERFHEEGWEKARRWVRDDLDWRAMLIEEYVAGAEVDVDCVVEKCVRVFSEIVMPDDCTEIWPLLLPFNCEPRHP
jgi:hypothetical protein